MGKKSQMGRNKKKAKAAKEANKPKPKVAAPRTAEKKQADGPAAYSADALLEKAEECMDSFSFELAQLFCERALQSEPENLRALELCGVVMLELDDMDRAKQCFERAVELSPDSGHSKYMYLGQLLTASDAVRCFRTGIDLMKKQLSENQQSEASAQPEDSLSVRDVSSACCSLAEIYMTDACFEDDAENICKKCLDEALELDSTNPEAYHLLASYYLSKEDPQTATDWMDKGLDLWLPQLREVDKSSEAAAIDPVQSCPVSYPARVNAAKIVIELKKYDVAAEILELLLDDDDEVVEVWYLLGWANHLQGDDYKDTARYYLRKAQKVAVQTKCEDEQLVKHTEELLEELGPGEGDDDSDGGDEGGEMDVDSSSEDEEEGGDGVKVNGGSEMEH